MVLVYYHKFLPSKNVIYKYIKGNICLMINLLKKFHYSFQLPVKISFLLCLYLLCTSVPSPFKLYDSFGEFLWQIFARILLLVILMITLSLPTYLICRFAFRKSYAKFILKKKTVLHQLKRQSKSKNKLASILRNSLHNFISYILMFFYIQPDDETCIDDVSPSDNDNKIITTKSISDEPEHPSHDTNTVDVASVHDNNEIIPTVNEPEQFDYETNIDNVPPAYNYNEIVLTGIEPDEPKHINYDTNTDDTPPTHNDSKVISHKNKPKKPKQKQMTQAELIQFAIACNQKLHKDDMHEWNSPTSFDTQHIQNFTNESMMINGSSTMTDFDSMTGPEFEQFCADILTKNTFTNVEITKGSHDQGIDILAEKEDIKYAIQCKCYSSNIGNEAVQEAFAGKAFYDCHVAVVLTNRFFTSSAQALAIKNGVLLWDRSKLQKLINYATKRNSSI